MNQIWNIARKEFSDGLRNRWLLAISLLFAVLAVGIAWLGAAASGQLGFTSIPATIASLASLATFLMPLIALLLAYDAIVGEDEGGTLMLLLTYPLGRGQILLGKFVGHGLILALAVLIGFGCAALAIAVLVEGVELEARVERAAVRLEEHLHAVEVRELGRAAVLVAPSRRALHPTRGRR